MVMLYINAKFREQNNDIKVTASHYEDSQKDTNGSL